MAKNEVKEKDIKEKDIKEKDIKVREEKEPILKENELLLPTGEHNENNEPILTKKIIKPTKLKYLIEEENRSFLYYNAIEQVGNESGIDAFISPEAIEILKNFLVSIFDDKKYVELILGDLDIIMILDIIRVVKIVNKIKQDDLKNLM